MKLLSFLFNNKEEIGIYHNDKVYALSTLQEFQTDMIGLISNNSLMTKARNYNEKILKGNNPIAPLSLSDVTLLAPIPRPKSCRDGYAFRQHVEAARRNRGVEMIPEFDQYPIFYFTNHNSITGPGEVLVMKDHLEKCDFELEIAIVIAKQGRNIPAESADEYIAGYTIMNDWSARVLQMEEMLLNLGPAKGKDFATSIGPYLVTPDELADKKIKTPAHMTGALYDLSMKAYHNGKLISQGTTADMTFTFAEIIERVSYGVDIYPGDVIGSGTVGTGCYLELNGTAARLAKEAQEPFQATWLNDGDEMILEIAGLGRLINHLKKVSDNSILVKKKIKK